MNSLILYEMIFLFFLLLLFDNDNDLTDEKLFFSLIIFYILFSQKNIAINSKPAP